MVLELLVVPYCWVFLDQDRQSSIVASLSFVKNGVVLYEDFLFFLAGFLAECTSISSELLCIMICSPSVYFIIQSGFIRENIQIEINVTYNSHNFRNTLGSPWLAQHLIQRFCRIVLDNSKISFRQPPPCFDTFCYPLRRHNVNNASSF